FRPPFGSLSEKSPAKSRAQEHTVNFLPETLATPHMAIVLHKKTTFPDFVSLRILDTVAACWESGRPELQQACSGTGPGSTARIGALLMEVMMLWRRPGGGRTPGLCVSVLFSLLHALFLNTMMCNHMPNLLGSSTRSAPMGGAVLQDPVYCDM